MEFYLKYLRHILALLLCVTLMLPMTACEKKENNGFVDITLNEVAHSIFYAPQYAAIELGYFKDENINLNLVTGFGADKVMTALVSGEADIGFMGSESSIYVYQEGSTDYAVNFAQLTQRAGNFLVSRNEENGFKWDDLKGKTVLGGRAGGMPESCRFITCIYKNFFNSWSIYCRLLNADCAIRGYKLIYKIKHLILCNIIV